MSLNCYNDCIVATYLNTGVTEDSLIFVDCSGNTNTVTILPDETCLINFCDLNNISGNTSGNIIQIYSSSNPDIYYFSSCCFDNQVFSVFGTETLMSVGDAVHGTQFISSFSGEIENYQCSVISGKTIYSVTPPTINGELISAINDFKTYTIAGCEECIEFNPCEYQCYGLLACDGDYPVLISTATTLSNYVDTFVNIEITSPSAETPTTQFLVKDLGIRECPIDYEFTIISTATTCDCYCFTFRVPEALFVTTYVDCEYNLFEEILPTGETVSICSIVEPIFDYIQPIPFRYDGLCVDNSCPNPINISILPRNECDVLTIFPMDVVCDVTNPSSSISYDGSASLIITGGTPPYNVVWDIGSVTQSISNLDEGIYNATVTDFYGDFVIETSCVLTSTTTSTTTTTTLSPLPIFGNLCAEVVYRTNDPDLPNVVEQIQFEYVSYLNDKPYWISDDSQYGLYWSSGNTNNWTISGFPYTNTVVVNTNPTPPPLSGWQVLGAPFILGVTIISGDCKSQNTLAYNLSINQALCNLGGGISFQAYGGSGTYQYSIDNGVSFTSNPVFQNLTAGNYTTLVEDTSGNTSTQTVTIPSQQAPNFVLTLTQNTATNTFQITSNLQPGYTITFDFNHISDFNYYPANVLPTPQYNNIVSVSGIPLPAPYIDLNTQTTVNPNCSLLPKQQINQHKEYKNTYTISSGQIITGTYTNSVSNPPTGYCQNSNSTFQIYLTNASVDDCKCCAIQVVNPLPQLPITKL